MSGWPSTSAQAGAGPSTPGPHRSTPRYRNSARSQPSPHHNHRVAARAASNAIRQAAAIGASKTRRGWLDSVYTFIMPVKRTVQVTYGAIANADPQSWWQYLSSTAMGYLGRTPKRKLQSMLDPELFNEYRRKELEARREQARQSDERRKQKEWAEQVASQVQQLGTSLNALPNTSDASDALTAGQQWRDVLKSTIPDPYAAAAKRDQEAAQRKRKATENAEASKPATDKSQRKSRTGLGKDHFTNHFKSDPSSDAEHLAFLEEYLGWTRSILSNNFSQQRFPKIRDSFDFKENDEANIHRIASILTDRGFLHRQKLNYELVFKQLWNARFRDADTMASLPKIYIPTTMIEPAPSYRPRTLSEKEREAMFKACDFSAIRAEWEKQTIYDLEFRLPTDAPLQPHEVELPDESFEVSRDDPRFRHMWRLLPGARLPQHYDEANSASQSRLSYKRLVSRRDLWFWQLVKDMESNDRSLGKVFAQYDLNRKRNELYWDGYKRVLVVQADELPSDLEIEEHDLIIDDEEPQATSLPPFTISQTYIPDAVAPSRDNRPRSVRRLPPDQRHPVQWTRYSSYSSKAWKSDEADLEDGDNFPSSRGPGFPYPKNEARAQADRLSRAFGETAAPAGKPSKKNKNKKKTVSFEGGHWVATFEPHEHQTGTPSPNTRTVKKLRRSDGDGFAARQSSLSPGARKQALAAHIAGTDTWPDHAGTFTRPSNVGEGSANPLKRRYQDSFSDAPREWRGLPNCFSAWDEDFEDSGLFYELDIKNGRLPKGVGTWETELEQTHGPKRVRVMRCNGTDQDFAIWDKDGVLRQLDWVPPHEEEDLELPVADVTGVRSKEPSQTAPSVASKPSVPNPRPDQLPDLSTALRGLVRPKTLEEERADYRAKAQSAPKRVAEQEAPSTAAQEDQDPFSFQSTYAKYRQELDKEREQRQARLSTQDEYEKDLARLRSPAKRQSTDISGETNSPRSFDSAGTPKPRRGRRRVESGPVEIDPSFPIFNPFETAPTQPRNGLARAKSETALPSPPLSNEDENSGKEDSTPGAKAKARLTGLFDPVQTQKAPFTVVEDSAPHEGFKSAAGTKVAQSFESDVTAPSSTASEESTNVLQPVVNGAMLMRQNSLTDVSKTQGLLPPAPITSTTAAPTTPLAAPTAAELGMFGAVRPSPSTKHGLDEDSGMDIDNTPLSAKRTRSPKEFGLVTSASASLAQSFKPTIPPSFDFGSMNAKPLFGGDNNAVVANANTSTSYVFGGAAASKPNEPYKFGATQPSTTTGGPFEFGGASTRAPPTLFGQQASKPAEKPASEPFVFGGKATATPTTTGLFGASTEPAPAVAPSIFGVSTAAPAAPSIFSGTSASDPPKFGATASTTNSLFGASIPAPSLFGASNNVPTSNGLFGAVSGVTSVPSFGSAPASSAPSFGEQSAAAGPTSQPYSFGATTSAPSFGGNNTATTSSSFTFGSTAATSQPPQFGSDAAKPTSASFTTGYGFGAGSNSSAPPSAYNFGATSNAASPAASGPTFGATNPGTNPGTPNALPPSTSDNNMFGFQPQQSNTFGRNIKAPVSRKPGSVRGRR
ncbi:hypothetical protein DRE_06821 [Drechslerella stenobrocha 248]|uniref:Uncharacterized protein n=1 Tax=Drechslerella stenobrocha 248 TaxID=1043628 RepID=W7HX15_9PEZI|nr:hypothetical protein DRE_06821 [Drechslerella stenobrocha 248]